MLGAMSAGCRASSTVERFAMAMVWRIESCRLRAVVSITTSDVATVMLWHPRDGGQLLLQTHHQDSVHSLQGVALAQMLRRVCEQRR